MFVKRVSVRCMTAKSNDIDKDLRGQLFNECFCFSEAVLFQKNVDLRLRPSGSQQAATKKGKEREWDNRKRTTVSVEVLQRQREKLRGRRSHLSYISSGLKASRCDRLYSDYFTLCKLLAKRTVSI